jgi:hypothetical protein
MGPTNTQGHTGTRRPVTAHLPVSVTPQGHRPFLLGGSTLQRIAMLLEAPAAIEDHHCGAGKAGLAPTHAG